MNDVGGSDSGTGLRAVKSSRTSDANFEYDDSEWDVGIGNLIIDLDADIEKNNEANRHSTSSVSSSSINLNPGSVSSNSNSPGNSSLPSGSSGTSAQMHIPHSSGNSSGNPSSNAGTGNNSSAGKSKSNTSALSTGGKTTAPAVTSDLSTSMEHSAIVDKGLKMKIKRTKTGTKSGADAKHEIVKSDLVTSSSSSLSTNAGSNSNSSSGSNKSGSVVSSESTSAKSVHSSSSQKDKDKIKDSNTIMIDAERDNATSAGGNSNHNSSGNNANNVIRDSATSSESGNKGKTPRKGSTHKKVKSSNNGSGSSKKEERNSNATSSDIKGSSSISSSGGSHAAKDGKDFFSTTVSLNVPTIIPNANSSFAKTTLKVPSATSSIPLNSQNSDQTNSSVGIDTPVSSRKSGHSSNPNSHWMASWSNHPGNEKFLGYTGSTVSNVERSQGSNGKKAKTTTSTDKASTNQEDGIPSSLGLPMATVDSSYRNASNSDLPNSSNTSSSSTNIQGGTSIPNSEGFPNSSKSSSVSMDPTLTQDICIGTSVGTVTEPDCLGPCEPGTSVTLEGIVWHETEGGVLVVNVTWRGKTYVGTLLDCTKNDWAPPRFCDSPTSDLEMRIPKNRAKRGRGQTATPVNEVQVDPRPGNAKLRNGAKGRRGSASNAAFVAPASPIKSEQWPKRKTRGSENEGQDEPTPKNAKRSKTVKDGDRKERKSNSPSPGMDTEKSGGPTSPVLIECPEPNCSKKYKHINGLRYHQSHAHNNFVVAEDSDSNASTASTQLATPAEVNLVELPSSEPMVIDELCDVNEPDVTLPIVIIEDPSASPVKRSTTLNGNLNCGIKADEKEQNVNCESELKKDKEISELVESPVSLIGKSSKIVKPPKDIPAAVKDGDVKLSTDSKDVLVSPIASRAPILTVPVPYISLQNRPSAHGHPVNVPRVDSSNGSRDQDNILMKPSPIGITNQVNPLMLSSKGVTWQPHAHTNQAHSLNTASSGSHSSVGVSLNIPLSGTEKTSSKDKDRNSATDSQGKKSRHKKKKDKDKSRFGESRGDGGKAHGGSDSARSSGNLYASSKIGESGVLEGRRTDSADDLRTSKRDDSVNKNDPMGMTGENRDDPQSPAYSDISDANDSGDTEINVGVKEGSKNLVVTPDPKKDTPVVGGNHSITSFYPSFYSPYLDSNHSSKLGEKAPIPEDPDKTKNQKLTAPPHGQGMPSGNPQISGNHPEESSRSPKMDSLNYHPHHPKFMPQPHFFHYPHSIYHYNQAQYSNNMMSENSFNGARSYDGLDEREKEREMFGDHHVKGKSSDKDVPSNTIIKQEPGERPKDRTTMLNKVRDLLKETPEEKRVEVKSEFGLDYSEPKSSMPHYMGATCSKHSKDGKRDVTNKNDSIGSTPSSDKPLSKEIPSAEYDKDLKDREREREKNEGSKPTMETQGPPPPPTAGSGYAYLPQPYLPGNHYNLHYDPANPVYRQVLVPGPYGGPPYMHPGSIPRFQPPQGATPLPEDLSRPNPSVSGTASNKALDMLQHHAAQYYNNVHKIHELSEHPLRSSTLKSPNPQASQRDREPPPGPSPSNTPSSPGGPTVGSVAPSPRSGSSSTSAATGIPKPADLSKDSKLGILGVANDSSRSPPTQHHVHSHTHHHTHVGIGYPIIPAFPAPHSPHYGVLPTTPAAASVIPSFPSQKPN